MGSRLGFQLLALKPIFLIQTDIQTDIQTYIMTESHMEACCALPKKLEVRKIGPEATNMD